MQLYVGSIGYSDCDAFATVIATTPEAIETELEKLFKEELEDYRNGVCDDICDDDWCEHTESFSLWDTGAMPEPALNLLHDIFGRTFRFPAFMWDDLRAGECIYLEV